MIMSKKEWAMAIFALVLGGIYAVYFTEWFRPKIIHVESSVRSLREAWSGQGQKVDLTTRPPESVSFAFPKTYQLTSVCVLSLDDTSTNGHAPALWHLVSKSGSAPVKGLSYGLPVEGMTNYLELGGPDPLQPGGRYRLIVEAGSYRGTNDFSLPLSEARRR